MNDVSITESHLPDHTVLRIVGTLDMATASVIERTVTKALLDSGRVVLDLSGLRTAQASALACFATALEQAGGWPQARLVLFGATPSMVTMLARSCVTKTVAHTPNVDDALHQLDQRPPLVRRTMALDPFPAALRQVRVLVTDAGRAWELPMSATEVATLVLNELAGHVLTAYARTDRVRPHRVRPHRLRTPLRAVVEFDGTRIRLSVTSDTDAMTPRSLEPTSAGGDSAGLVEALSEHWGIARRRRGTTVWAALPPITGSSPRELSAPSTSRAVRARGWPFPRPDSAHVASPQSPAPHPVTPRWRPRHR